VQEIVQVPETVIHVPHSESHVLGVMTLRNRLLPLVRLRRIFGLPDSDLDEKSRIVVLTLNGASVGVVVDAVSEVLRVSKSGVDALPALLAHEGNLAEVTAICRLDNGKRLVSIMTARNLFDHSAIKEALNTVNESELVTDAESKEADDSLDDDEQVVIFHLDREEFGAPIASVQEIVRVPEELVRVPQAPSFVEGVINLRGTVLPVIDLRLRLGLKQVERTDRQRIKEVVLHEYDTNYRDLDIDGIYFPCSFTENEFDWQEGLNVLECQDFMQDCWWNQKTSKFRQSNIDCQSKCESCVYYEI